MLKTEIRNPCIASQSNGRVMAYSYTDAADIRRTVLVARTGDTMTMLNMIPGFPQTTESGLAEGSIEACRAHIELVRAALGHVALAAVEVVFPEAVSAKPDAVEMVSPEAANVTDLEADAIQAIGNNDFTDGDPTAWVWSNCVAQECKTVKAKQLPGVISSLVKKGLAETDGNSGKDACVRLTETGVVALKQIGN